jgi:uncharacterized protein
MLLDTNKTHLIQDFFAHQPVLKAYLFGSYSRGEATQHSDIDLLVELDYSEPIGLAFIQMRLDLETLLAQKVDLVSARGLSKFIAPIIHQEKQLIYAR